MCRNIKTEEIRVASLQYVRKISGLKGVKNAGRLRFLARIVVDPQGVMRMRSSVRDARRRSVSAALRSTPAP